MKKDLLAILPQETWINILGRLPFKSIAKCKCVCKSCRDMIEGGDFATSPSYTLEPCLAFGNEDMGYGVCDEECQPLFQFGLAITSNHCRVVISSVNGLLLMWDGCVEYHDILFLCNPMTREYVELPHMPLQRYMYGFGVSRLSGQYKILLGDQSRPRHVYTLGRERLWRSIGVEVATTRLAKDDAVFLNGNLHWLANDSKFNKMVCCFDLEIELFTSFSVPRVHHGYRGNRGYSLCILEDSLCYCDISDNLHVFIWKMNNYVDSDSWVKEYTFDQRPYIGEIDEMGRPNPPIIVSPHKVLANGDLLFTVNTDDQLFIYSKNAEAVERRGRLQRSIPCYFSNVVIYTPTFISLKRMGIHDVKSFKFH